ncbi:hypothetical protein BHMPCIPO_02036 [Ensifer sesbaniae]|nr:hypothetical protein [Ensifer sesbaniae]
MKVAKPENDAIQFDLHFGYGDNCSRHRILKEINR